MPLTFSTKGSGDVKRVSPGSHFAVCDQVVFLGLQEVGGMFPKTCHQIYIRFEIPAERWEFEKDGKKQDGPAVIGRIFTASMHKKASLRKQLEGWRGKEFTEDEAGSFDVASILGKPCMLTVTEKESGGNIYSNITGVSQMPKGSAKVTAEFPLRYYAPDDQACFESLPEWLRDKITNQIKPEMVNQSKQTTDYDPDQPPVDSYENDYANPEITDGDIPF